MMDAENKEQEALAFLMMLTETEEMGMDHDGNVATKEQNPVAMTHLRAVFGPNHVTSAWDLRASKVRRPGRYDSHKEASRRVLRFSEYLRRMADTMTELATVKPEAETVAP